MIQTWPPHFAKIGSTVRCMFYLGHLVNAIRWLTGGKGWVPTGDQNRVKLKTNKETIRFNACFATVHKNSTEDMILALAGQLKQLSHEPEKFRSFNGIRTHDLCDAGAVL